MFCIEPICDSSRSRMPSSWRIRPKICCRTSAAVRRTCHPKYCASTRRIRAKRPTCGRWASSCTQCWSDGESGVPATFCFIRVLLCTCVSAFLEVACIRSMHHTESEREPVFWQMLHLSCVHVACFVRMTDGRFIYEWLSLLWPPWPCHICSYCGQIYTS